MRILFALIGATLLAACMRPDAGKDANTLEAPQPEEVNTGPAISHTKKFPTTFDLASDVAQVNDLETFFRHFKINSDTLRKGEFETTEEHENRISSTSAFGSFVTDQPYAVTVAKGSQLRYWADSEVFFPLGGRLCTHFDFPYTINRHEQTACEIGEKWNEVQDDYYGDSAPGRPAESTQASEIRFNFVVPITSAGISKSRSVPGAYHLKGHCSIERDKAEAMSGKLGLAYLVTLNSPRLIRGPRNIEGPSSHPRKITFYEGIDVHLMGHICYELDSNLIVRKELY